MRRRCGLKRIKAEYRILTDFTGKRTRHKQNGYISHRNRQAKATSQCSLKAYYFFWQQGHKTDHR